VLRLLLLVLNFSSEIRSFKHRTGRHSVLQPAVYSRRSCLSSCWSESMEHSAHRLHTSSSVIATSFQEQTQNLFHWFRHRYYVQWLCL